MSANTVISDNTVFHDTKITDIAEELDANDKYVTKDNGYKFKDSRQMVLYDVIDFKQTYFKIKLRTSPTAMQNAGSDRNVMSSDITVPQKAQSVNTSISENSENDTEKKLNSRTSC